MTMEVKHVEGKGNVITVDERKQPNIRRFTNLKRAKLPIKCNDCPYRAKEDGGNGICVKYKKDSICRIRSDARKMIDKFRTDNPDQILPMMKEEFDSNYEILKTFESLENMSNMLNPEVTKRINALTGLGKMIHELETKKITTEIEERKTLTEGKKEEIARMLRQTVETSHEA